MYSVSLLPYEYRLINTKARKKNVNLLIAMGVMGVFFLIYVILSVVITTNNAKLKDIRKEAAVVENQISEIDDILNMSNDVSKLLNEATLAAGTNPEWGELITNIGNSVPESVSLISIDMKYETSEGECSIKGTGLTHKSVSEWMQRLEKVKDIGEIKCVISTQTAHQEENSPVNFELNIPLQKGPGYQLPTEVAGNE